tara:strand:- start:3473 stop:3919 length:447 start_codon:yes stop_codon:yes gene_type:complete
MNNKIPPPIVTLTFGLFIYFSRPFFPEFNNELLSIVSGLSLLIGIGVLVSAVASFRKQKTTVNPLDIEKASSLVISGVFKYSRNPMYLGMVFILLSIALKFNLIGGIILTLLFAIFITRFQIIPEEVVMEKLFKEEFDSYKKKTRRWL